MSINKGKYSKKLLYFLLFMSQIIKIHNIFDIKNIIDYIGLF